MTIHNPLISVIVVTENEESNVGACLNTINWADELIIIDSYSSDKTVEICKRYTNLIYSNRFIDFSQQRNFGLQKVSKKMDWILVLDADESMPEIAQVIIRETLKKNSSIEGYWLPRRNYITPKKYLKHGVFYPDYQLRLFRNNKKILFKGSIHAEAAIIPSKTKKLDSLEIIHNSSRTKYNSFYSYKRLLPYIQAESRELTQKRKSKRYLFLKGVWDLFYIFYQSFLRGKGYKDGYAGFRAAVIYSAYRSSISFNALFQLR